MNQETMLYLYHKMSGMIEERRNGRTIVLLGDSESYRTFLKEKYGQEEVMLLTTIKKKASDKVVYIGDIRHQNDKYFIVVPRIKKTLDLQLKLHSFGYTDFEDCFFINHDKISLDTYVDDYTDEYGNHIHAPSCQVILEEYTCGVTVDVDPSCRFEENSLIVAKTFGGAHVRIGKNCVFEENVTLTVFGDADVTIGENTTFVRDTEIIVLGGMTLSIGKDCLFSFEIKIYCGDGHAIFDLHTRERLNPQNKNHPKNIISIGDHVWVGMRSILLNKTTIGSSSIVGAGAIVKGDYPNNCIIAGTPAQVIRRDITWSKDSLANTPDAIPEEYLTFTRPE